MLETLKSNLSKLYYTTNDDDLTLIDPNISIDGCGINFIFKYLDNKDCILATTKTNNEYLEYLYDDYDKNILYINKINARFKTTFDEENQIIFLKFRRNELSLTQAITNLSQAVYLYANLTLILKKSPR